MIKVKEYRGHIRNWNSLCKELGIDENLSRESREEAILIKAYETWGCDMAMHMHGNSLYFRIAFLCVTSDSAMVLIVTYCSVCNLTFCFLAILIVHIVRAMPIGKLISKYIITNIINAVSKSLFLRNNKHGSITMNIIHTTKSIKKVR